MAKLNITEIINASKFNRFHLNLLILGFIIILFDGYDIAVYGTLAPLLIEEWNLTPVEAGAIGSYGLFGMLFGAIFFGTLADRIGRKQVILITVILFSFFTALCGFADNPTIFSVFRFIAGLGLGGIMPNVIALLTDYSPKKIQSMIIAVVLCGYSVGGMLGPLMGIYLIPTLGWESVLWMAGIPLFFLPLIYKLLPESTSVLTKKGKTEELTRLLKKINPDIEFDKNTKFFEEVRSQAKLPLTDLFKENKTLSTVMFWLVFFSSLLMGYGLINWLPKLMMDSGYAFNSSLTFLIVLQGGSIIGALVMGRLSDKYGLKNMVIPMYILAAIVLTLLGISKSVFLTYILVAIAGATTVGSQNLVQAYVSQYYPPYVRSTALGSASSVGRIGGMLGPLLGGFLLSLALPNQMIFIAFAIPGLIAALALVMVPDRHGYYRLQVTRNHKEDFNSVSSGE